MRNICILLIFVSLSCCSPGKEYKLYRRDRSINYPEEKLIITLTDDHKGSLTNSKKGRESFTQQFIYRNDKNEFLIIESVKPGTEELISLSAGDTITRYKNQLHFFYNGQRKYFLSFKKKI